MQYRYGSRFFLPNRWRTKVYEFRRDIAVDVSILFIAINKCFVKLTSEYLVNFNKQSFI